MKDDSSTMENVENYLEDKMTSEEKHAFEKRVKEDADFRKEVIFYSGLLEKLKEEERREAKAVLNEAHEKHFSAKGIQVKMYYRIAASVGIFFVFSGLAYFFFFSEKPSVGGGKHIVFFQKEIVADDGSLGFTEGNERIESVIVKIEKTGEEPAYQFTDTLRLRLPELPAEDQLKLEYLTKENEFVLSLEQKVYKCYKGFNYYQPLESNP